LWGDEPFEKDFGRITEGFTKFVLGQTRDVRNGKRLNRRCMEMSATAGRVSIRVVGMGADGATIIRDGSAKRSTLPLHSGNGMGIQANEAISQRQCSATEYQEYSQHGSTH